MNIEYLRTAKKSYMIVKNANYTYENYELQMILKNNIPSLLQFQIIAGDDAVEYWYDVTGMQSMDRQFVLKQVDGKYIKKLLTGVIDMKCDMDMYLLDDRNISFLTDMIYYDRFSDKIRFCYVPGLSGQDGYEIRHLFEDILQHLDHRDPLAVSIGYDIYERSMSAEFVVEDCRECLRIHDKKCEKEQQLEEILSGAGEMSYTDADYRDAEYRDGDAEYRDRNYRDIEKRFGQNSDLMQELNMEDYEPERKKHRRFARKRKKKKRKIAYHRYLDEEQEISYAAEDFHHVFGDREPVGQTQYFAPEELADSWELIYKGDGLEKDLQMTSFPFFIGTDSDKVQGVLQSRTVSRVHARFWKEDGKLMIEDYNSTNGTYLNHHLLPMNTPTEVQPGDRIVVATEEFMVYCRKVPKQQVQRA